MDAIEEKRIFDRKGVTEVVYVAGETGCVRARVGGIGAVGEFSLCHREACRDVAVRGDRPVLATEGDVHLGPRADGDDAVALEFGPAVAVATHDGGVLAAGPDGTVGRWTPEGDDPVAGSWGAAWSLDSTVRALAGSSAGQALAATAGGVVRLAPDGPEPAGLEDVRDVALADVPLAAAGAGCYRLGNGWQRDLAVESTAIAGAPDGRAMAATVEGPFVRDAPSEDWGPVVPPTDERVVDVALGRDAYAVTAGGTLLAAGDGAWRPNPVGLRAAAAVAVGGE